MIEIGITGQPNTGKSTLFNQLTGLRQHVGNWPGKTVEKKTGRLTLNGEAFSLIDLPGTYSLTARSPEEVIARDFIIKNKPSIVIVIINASSIEKSLYFLSEILHLPTKVIVALNMTDIASEKGLEIDLGELKKALNVEIVSMVASKGKGIEELKKAIMDMTSVSKEKYSPNISSFNDEQHAVINQLSEYIHFYEPYPKEWLITKLLEGDRIITRFVKETSKKTWNEINEILDANSKIMLNITSKRYEWITEIKKKVIKKVKNVEGMTLTEKRDKKYTRPVMGKIRLALLFFGGLILAMIIAMPISMFIFIVLIQEIKIVILQSVGIEWLALLLAHGVIGGVGAVLAFLPVYIAIVAIFGWLEDTGYMARAAYVADGMMSRFGLHGKSFLPVLLGFMCNAMATPGSRVIEDKRTRMATIFITPLVPCAATLSLVATLAMLFFNIIGMIIILPLLLVGMFFFLILTGKFLNKIYPSQSTGMLLELPEYHKANFKTILSWTWNKTKFFIIRAGSIILIFSIVIWTLSYLPNGDIDTSYLATIGQFLEPLGQLMGLDWRGIVSLISAITSKEQALASMAIIYGAESELNLATVLSQAMSPAASLAFIVTLFLFLPCVATIGIVYSESKSFKWTSLLIGWSSLIAFGSGIIVYQIASLLYGG